MLTGVLAAGLAVAIMAFQVFNVVVLRPLPVRDPASLVQFERRGPESVSTVMSYPAFRFVREHNAVLSAAFAQMPARVQLGPEGDAAASARFVSADYFQDLGASCSLGRFFDSEEIGDDAVAVLSHDFWRRRFAADPGIIGHTIRVNRRTATVRGVLSAGFSGLRPSSTDLWLPIEQHPLFFAGSDLLRNPARKEVVMFGRLGPGVTRAAAESALKPVWEELRRQQPGHTGRSERLVAEAGGYAMRISPHDYGLLLFFGVLVLMALAISAANAAVLELARAVARRPEIRIRASLGASRLRILRQLLTESLLVCCGATAAGLAISFFGTGLILQSLEIPLRVYQDLDWRVAGAAAVLMVFVTLLFGLAPAIHLSRGRAGGTRTQTLLISVQVTASCILLIVAGIYARGLHRVLTTPQGFEIERVFSVNPLLAERGFTAARARLELDELSRRASEMPSVRSAAVCTMLPLSADYWKEEVRGNGRSVTAYANAVSPRFFETMRIAILHGRVFRDGETGVAVMSESLARKVWPGEDPIGKTANGLAVVGVAANARTNALRDGDAVEVYYPLDHAQAGLARAVLVIRTTGSPAQYLPAIRARLQPANAPPLRVDLMTTLFAERTEGTRKGSVVIGATGLAMLLLTAAGIGGLVSFGVSQRTREIGIRVALGASAGVVMRLALTSCVVATGSGIACGAGAGYLLSSLLRTQIYGLSRLDAGAYTGTAGLILLVSAIATIAPVMRAISINPARALKQD
jgi:predicted permease